MKYFLFLLVGLAASNGTFAQHRDIDSLKALLPKASTKEEIKILLELCWGYRFINADSARDFGLRALSAAKEAKLEALEAGAMTKIKISDLFKTFLVPSVHFHFDRVRRDRYTPDCPAVSHATRGSRWNLAG